MTNSSSRNSKLPASCTPLSAGDLPTVVLEAPVNVTEATVGSGARTPVLDGEERADDGLDEADRVGDVDFHGARKVAAR